jgi:potassium-transporting ATPase potassium-binding subunit
MLVPDLVQPLALLCAVLALTPPLGGYIARVMGGERTLLDPVAGPLERLVHRALRLDPARGQTWKGYARSLLVFSLASIAGLYLLQRVQGLLPANPGHFGAVDPYLALNTAVSFATNTDWQNYAGEATMSHLTQMAGLATQNFVSAGVGLAVAVALIRGLTGRRAATIGNFWADLTRGILLLLLFLPLSILLAVALMGRGVIQNFDGPRQVATVGGASQALPGGPVAANSAHPYENPDPVTNFLEMLALLAIPFALTATYGRLVGSRRQGWAPFAAMAVIWAAMTATVIVAEQAGNPIVARAGVDQAQRTGPSAQAGGNLEGKEVRFGIGASGAFAASTTGISTGAVNSSHDSYTAAGGLVPTALILLGEVSPGGVGTGLYTMLVFVLLAVFIAGLMVGRTPEWLGKKIQAREVKLAGLAILVMPVLVLCWPGSPRWWTPAAPRGSTRGRTA